jgi:hypothetical protein
MPFKSKAQMRWMFENHPGMARHWAHETSDVKALPARSKSSRRAGKANAAKKS